MKKLKALLSSSIYRVTLIAFAVMIPLNLLTLVLGRRVISEAEEHISLELRHTLTLYLNQADEATKRIDTYMALLAIDDPNYLRLRDKAINNEEERYRQIQAVVDLQATLKDKKQDETLISGIYAYFPEKGLFAMHGISSYKSYEARNRIFEEINEGRAAGQRVRLLSVGDRAVLAVMSEHRGVWYGSWIDLPELAKQIPLEEGRLLAFTDREGRVLYSSTAFPEQIDPESSRLSIDGASYLVSSGAAPSGELYAVELVPARQLSGALPFAIRLLQILSVAALIALPILLLAIQHWIITPVRQLTEAIGHVERGEMDYRIQEGKTGTEFLRINRSFNHMMDQVEALKISVYEEQLKAQKIKLGFLAQQIKPHFILNTLNILYSYEQEEFPLIQKMIVHLSRYFRYVVNANQDFVTLGKEMEHLRNYFAIQEARYVQTFTTRIHIDAELEECLIPPLLIQSFAENTVKHALLPDRTVEIAVEARKTETGMCITVSDTGRGIPQETLERIERFKREREFQMDLGIGIQNSIDRVDLLYSGQGRIDVTRRAEGGTVVSIELPALRMHDAEASQLRMEAET